MSGTSIIAQIFVPLSLDFYPLLDSVCASPKLLDF